MKKPILIEQYAYNGKFSNWHLIEEETGEVLWSSFPKKLLLKDKNNRF